MKIISGGQTGVDRAALEAAKEAGIETGGFAAYKYETEKGVDKSLKTFGLIDSGASYSIRTIMNVVVSDMTLWFGREDTSGFFATARAADKYEKPLYIMTYASPRSIYLLIKHAKVINIAGNRESKNPGIFKETKNTLNKVFEMIKNDTSINT